MRPSCSVPYSLTTRRSGQTYLVGTVLLGHVPTATTCHLNTHPCRSEWTHAEPPTIRVDSYPSFSWSGHGGKSPTRVPRNVVRKEKHVGHSPCKQSSTLRGMQTEKSHCTHALLGQRDLLPVLPSSISFLDTPFVGCEKPVVGLICWPLWINIRLSIPPSMRNPAFSRPLRSPTFGGLLLAIVACEAFLGTLLVCQATPFSRLPS